MNSRAGLVRRGRAGVIEPLSTSSVQRRGGGSGCTRRTACTWRVGPRAGTYSACCRVCALQPPPHPRPGRQEPLAPTVSPEGINCAVYSPGAARMALLLFDNITDRRPSQIIPLSPETNRTGNIWHMFIEGLPNRTLYNIRVDGPNE